MQYVKKLAWSVFRQSVLLELDKITIIKELLCVKFGFWPTVLSVEPMVQYVVCLSVCLSVTFCIVAKWCVLAKKCLKE